MIVCMIVGIYALLSIKKYLKNMGIGDKNVTGRTIQ